MRLHKTTLLCVVLLLATGCNSGESSGSGNGQDDGPIGSDENNRYELDFAGGISTQHTGGLICSVEDGDLVLDFSIDASDGEYEYTATFGAFDPGQSSFSGTMLLNTATGDVHAGPMTATFSYGPAPDDFVGVVRAAGTLDGTLEGPGDPTEVSGSYACFLMDSEVGS